MIDVATLDARNFPSYQALGLSDLRHYSMSRSPPRLCIRSHAQPYSSPLARPALQPCVTATFQRLARLVNMCRRWKTRDTLRSKEMNPPELRIAARRRRWRND